MSPRVPAPPALFELESEVMEEVWRQGRTNVRAVMEALNKKRKKDRAYTTYMTIMARLARKGLLHREREGRADLYWPRLTREEFLRSRAQQQVSTLVSEFGDVALVHFAKEMDKLDPARVKQLRRMARGE
jgi:predicted transcriptional regulator